MNQTQVPVIQINLLTKHFKQVIAVDDLSLEVYQGDIFGFLGPNGSGKSTTIRMLLSLISPDRGSIRLFGLPLHGHRVSVLSRIGAIIEKPDLYLFLSAYKNLKLLCRLSRLRPDHQKIVEVLELVGLSDRMHSKVKTFSHGMKQRLGIAQALIHDPQLLILDEPDSGLDPQGIKDIRELIRFLNQEKKITIFLSSHKLYEVEQIASRMAIIKKGKTIVQGVVRELLQESIQKVNIDTEYPEEAVSLLSDSRLPIKEMRLSENRLVIYCQVSLIPEIIRFLVEHGLNVTSACPEQSLEEFYISKTWEYDAGKD